MKLEESLGKALLLKSLRNKPLLIFVSGSDESMQNCFRKCMNDLEGEPFDSIIAVKLLRDSEDYESFLEIYPDIYEPFIIVLGEKGIPMKIVKLCQTFDEDEVCKVVNETLLFCTSTDDYDSSSKKTVCIEEDSEGPRAVIQFRMSDGGATIHAFSYNTTVTELADFVRDQIKPNCNFQLALPHPFHILREDSVTVSDLDLYPSAVVMVIPISDNRINIFNSAGRNVRTCLFWIPFDVLIRFSINLFNAIKDWFYRMPSILFPTRRPSSSIPGPRPVVNVQGNIYSLGSEESDDDSQNRDNGNSTQQK